MSRGRHRFLAPILPAIHIAAFDVWTESQTCIINYLLLPLTVTEGNIKMDNSPHENTYEINDSKVDKDAVGTTINHKHIYVIKAYSRIRPDKKTSSTPAHEIGHTLGMGHQAKGIMTKSQDENRSDKVTSENIYQMMTSSAGKEEKTGFLTIVYDWLKKGE